ncbi:TetR/AcrR family transcriptional regulator [Rhodoplanes roseus]|uniref:TetR family transcriptional regulator n=1 Tax=Rhodoplanes roseus TaxID=29409 RepID=A0A327L1P2_9BRAD|nr:TetR/AcrR family transcriptional regulator [Rhodoplanes roseus]RAI43392.1 TetR family transcriptional regulator [Rhodoplanes roseus]
MPSRTAAARRSAAEAPEKTVRRTRDPVATRRALLEAARREFAAKGLAGARVDEIAERAGVNKQLVYHHFGDKDALYLAVLEWLYDEIRAAEREVDLAGMAPEEAIAHLIGISFDHLAAHPDFVSLLTDENRHGAVHVRRSPKLPTMHSPLIALIASTLEKGAEAGVFRHGIDPMQLYISIAALGYFYFSNLATLATIFKRRLDSRPAVTARRAHVVDLVMHSLRP